MVMDGVPLKKILTDWLEDDVVAADYDNAATRLYDTGTTPRRGADAPTDTGVVDPLVIKKLEVEDAKKIRKENAKEIRNKYQSIIIIIQ